jgi:hypothetical protein
MPKIENFKNDPNLTLTDDSSKKNIKKKLTQKLTQTKSVFLEWSQSVTYHCFPKIFKEKTRFLMRFIWTLIFLTFSGLTCYILINNVISYYQFSVVSTIQVVSESESVFPAVTICHSNPYTTKYAQNLTYHLAFKNLGIKLDQVSFDYFNKYVLISLSYYMNLYVNDPRYGDENRKLLGIDISEIISSCYFNFLPCNLDDFQWVFHFSYGNCLKYNTHNGNLKKTINPGKTFGLQLRIGPFKSDNNYPLSLSTGLKIFISNQSVTPNSVDNFISIEPGKETDIAVDRTLTLNTPKPYSACTDLTKGYNSELYKFLMKSNKTYRQSDCIDLCYQRHIQNKCKCFSSVSTRIHETLACLNSTQIDCLMNIYQNFDINSCSLDCPLECEFVSYNFQVSSVIYPSLEYYNMFKNDSGAIENFSTKFEITMPAYESFREYFYAINIYYSSLKYTYISESPQMTVLNLLSSLGGSLGMFLGFSVFSLLEVIELLFELVWSLVFSKF